MRRDDRRQTRPRSRRGGDVVFAVAGALATAWMIGRVGGVSVVLAPSALVVSAAVTLWASAEPKRRVAAMYAVVVVPVVLLALTPRFEASFVIAIAWATPIFAVTAWRNPTGVGENV